jgi:hypothetical protein
VIVGPVTFHVPWGSGSDDDLIKTFVGRPEKTEFAGADEISVTLTRPKGDVEITPRSSEVQTVSRLNITKWIWDAEPKRTGTIILTLDVHPLLPTDKTKPFLNENVSIMPTRRIEIPVP